MAPEEQVIDVIAGEWARYYLGVHVGSLYKMKITNHDNNKTFYIRSRIVHSLKAAPGFELLKYYCFIS